MDPIPRTRAQELISALRPAIPGLAVAVAALVLAVVSLIVALFHHPLDLLATLAGLVIAAPLALAATWSGGLLRKITLPMAILTASVAATLLLMRGRPVPFVLASSSYWFRLEWGGTLCNP
jgi:hypothetical protein